MEWIIYDYENETARIVSSLDMAKDDHCSTYTLSGRANGVPYHESLAGPDGAEFTLFVGSSKEKAGARAWLRDRFDVVRLRVLNVKWT